MTKEGKIVYFDVSKFNSDDEMYETLWKELYGIDLPKENDNFIDSLVDYINGEKNFV